MLYQRSHRRSPNALQKTYRFRRLAGEIAVQPLLDELDRVPEAAWLPSQWKWHLGTWFLVLRGGEPTAVPGSALASGGGVDAPILATLPALRRLLDEGLPTPVPLAWIGRSPPGSCIRLHIDNLPWWDEHHRIHLPLRTSPQARLCADGRFLHLPAGSLWAFDNSRPHGALNDGPERLHLVLDLPPTPAVEAWLAAGTEVPGEPDEAAFARLARNPLDDLKLADLQGDLLTRLLDQ